MSVVGVPRERMGCAKLGLLVAATALFGCKRNMGVGGEYGIPAGGGEGEHGDSISDGGSSGTGTAGNDEGATSQGGSSGAAGPSMGNAAGQGDGAGLVDKYCAVKEVYSGP